MVLSNLFPKKIRFACSVYLKLPLPKHPKTYFIKKLNCNPSLGKSVKNPPEVKVNICHPPFQIPSHHKPPQFGKYT